MDADDEIKRIREQRFFIGRSTNYLVRYCQCGKPIAAEPTFRPTGDHQNELDTVENICPTCTNKKLFP